jgi:hypothetical protein
MDEDQEPGGRPQIQAGRAHMPPQGNKDAHKDAKDQDRGKFVEKVGHEYFSELRRQITIPHIHSSS